MKRHIQTALWAVISAIVLGVSIVGCGSGSKSPAAAPTGRATITVRWPDEEESRLIPVRSNSIRVRLTDTASAVVGEAVLTRANPSTTFNPLPTGVLTVLANAYPETNGTGVAQATATAPLVILADTNTPITMTLASTITQLELTPASNSLLAGTTQQFTATTKNSAGEIVLTSPSTIQWSVAPAGAATISSTGLLTAVKPGATTLTVKESESGVQASRALTVITNVTVTILPDTVTISPSRTANLTATVNNLPNGADAGVTWSVTGGTITQGGLYTAPATTGTFTATATSKFDPSKSGTRTITVKNGTINVVVD